MYNKILLKSQYLFIKQQLDDENTDKWVRDMLKEYLEKGGDIYNVAQRADTWPSFFNYKPYP